MMMMMYLVAAMAMTMVVVLMMTTIILTTSMNSRPDLMNPGPRVLLLPGIERPDINSKLYLLSFTYLLISILNCIYSPSLIC